MFWKLLKHSVGSIGHRAEMVSSNSLDIVEILTLITFSNTCPHMLIAVIQVTSRQPGKLQSWFAGNLLVLRDGKIGFIDFGIVGRIPPATWLALQSLAAGFQSSDFELMARCLPSLPQSQMLRLLWLHKNFQACFFQTVWKRQSKSARSGFR